MMTATRLDTERRLAELLPRAEAGHQYRRRLGLLPEQQPIGHIQDREG